LGSENRPWGNYEVIKETDSYKIKVITVEPGQRLSYQVHDKRDEYWVVISGNGLLTVNGTDSTCFPGTAICIEANDAHRVANTGTTPLIFAEVQLGTYFGEDDIIRIDDDYGRGAKE